MPRYLAAPAGGNKVRSTFDERPRHLRVRRARWANRAIIALEPMFGSQSYWPRACRAWSALPRVRRKERAQKLAGGQEGRLAPGRLTSFAERKRQIDCSWRRCLVQTWSLTRCASRQTGRLPSWSPRRHRARSGTHRRAPRHVRQLVGCTNLRNRFAWASHDRCCREGRRLLPSVSDRSGGPQL